jgi:hypothetical protein
VRLPFSAALGLIRAQTLLLSFAAVAALRLIGAW